MYYHPIVCICLVYTSYPLLHAEDKRSAANGDTKLEWMKDLARVLSEVNNIACWPIQTNELYSKQKWSDILFLNFNCLYWWWLRKTIFQDLKKKNQQWEVEGSKVEYVKIWNNTFDKKKPRGRCVFVGQICQHQGNWHTQW